MNRVILQRPGGISVSRGRLLFQRRCAGGYQDAGAVAGCGAIHENWLKNGGVSMGSWKEMFQPSAQSFVTAWAIAPLYR